MTAITFFRTADGRPAGYKASGHATDRVLSRKEYDLVCCAVSVLTQTGVNALEAVAGVRPDVTVHDGYLQCMIPANTDAEKLLRAETVMETVMQGLSDISKSYPKYIRIMTQEWRHEDAYDESSALRS